MWGWCINYTLQMGLPGLVKASGTPENNVLLCWKLSGEVSDLNVQERHPLVRILSLVFLFQGSSVIPTLRSTQQYGLQWNMKNRPRVHTWATIKGRGEKGVYVAKKNQEERRKVPLSLQTIPACLELTVLTQRKDRCTIFSSLMWKSLIQPMITA